MQLTTEEQYRLAIKAKCCVRTVRRWLAGESVSRMTEAALTAAAKALHIKTEGKRGRS